MAHATTDTKSGQAMKKEMSARRKRAGRRFALMK